MQIEVGGQQFQIQAPAAVQPGQPFYVQVSAIWSRPWTYDDAVLAAQISALWCTGPDPASQCSSGWGSTTAGGPSGAADDAATAAAADHDAAAATG